MVEDGTALDMVAPTPRVLCLYDDKDLGSRLTALDERCLLPVKQEVSCLFTSSLLLTEDEAVFEVSFSTRGVRMCCLFGADIAIF